MIAGLLWKDVNNPPMTTSKKYEHILFLFLENVIYHWVKCISRHSVAVARYEDHSTAATEMWGVLFQQGKWFSGGDWDVLFWLWSSSLLFSTGAMNKTFTPVRRGTLARGSTVQLQLENRGAPHHEKCAKSQPFDRKSCRGEILGDWVQI